jgi:hypothetical protein
VCECRIVIVNNNNSTLCRRCRRCRRWRFSLDIIRSFVHSFVRISRLCRALYSRDHSTAVLHAMCMTVCVTVACNVYALMHPCTRTHGVSSTSCVRACTGKSTATAAGVCVAWKPIHWNPSLYRYAMRSIVVWIAECAIHARTLHSYVRMPACLLCAMHVRMRARVWCVRVLLGSLHRRSPLTSDPVTD